MLKGVLLVAGILVVLAGSSVADEVNTWDYTFETVGWLETIIITLAVAVLATFLDGVVNGRSSHLPLRLGLVALGIGLLGTASDLSNGAAALANAARCNPADFAYCVKLALWNILLGLVVATFGGLFTWILHARAKRLERGDHAADIIEVPRSDRHVFVPLWLGLFALSLGLLVSIYGLINFLDDIASKIGPRFHFALLAQSFAFAKWGAVAALTGGLLSWILHERAKRSKEVVAEQDGTKERPSE